MTTTLFQWNDQAVERAEQDRLRFDQYCGVLSEVVLEADTPLTVGVFGPWGSGKTSLMGLVRSTLAGHNPPPLTVWFNAWKYDQREALWRALIIQVLNEFRYKEEDSSPLEAHPMQIDKPAAAPALTPEQTALNKRLDDLEASLYRPVEREEVGGVTIDWEKLVKGSVLGLTHLSLSVLPGIGPILGKMMEKAQEKISGEDLTMLFEAVQRERRKIYREHLRSLEQFQHNFESLVRDEVLAKERRLIIFIDDLDRCLPEKAIEVLEAIKLFLDAPGCVFILGADREVIRRGIRVKYKDFSTGETAATDRRIPISGDDYLEKIVQVPFHLLPLDEARVEQFIQKSGETLPPACAEVFVAGLEANPRKIKRTLNIFRLLHKLAEIRQAEFQVDGQGVEIQPELLAKIVVIQNRYRDLYHELVEYPALLPQLERYFSGAEGESGNPAGENSPPEPTLEDVPPPAGQMLRQKYQHLRWLRRLLTCGQGRFAPLPLTEVRLYLYLTYTTGEPGQTAADEAADRRWLEALLSQDPAKVESALAAIREEGAEGLADFQQRLLLILAQPGSGHPLQQRLAAGAALARLGDPRNLGEMVPVPVGRYPLGAANTLHNIEGFSIGKYPVTNAQYQRFVESTQHPAPSHWPGATCPPELANHPVTYVSHKDAIAYCAWAKCSLPSAEQWEVAARGDTSRHYPYGDEPKPEAGNSLETGLGNTTPVGTFPEGASPFGLLDMAGNVWEWTRTEAEGNYLLKGGGWDAPMNETSCLYSRSVPPELKNSSTGFRVIE